MAHYNRLGHCPKPTVVVTNNNYNTSATTTTADASAAAVAAISTGRWHINTIASQLQCQHLCTGDSSCPAAQRCCTIGCARSCQPVDLARVPLALLPAIPHNVTVTTLLPMQPHSVSITFLLNLPSNGDVDVRLMLEARNHAGFAFRPRRMGQWHEQPYTHTMTDQSNGGRLIMHGLTVDGLRPGRWYQFRASTMGVRGTRGYSAPTGEFQLKESE